MKYRVYFYSFDYSKFADTLIDAERIGRESGFPYTINEVIQHDKLSDSNKTH